MILEHGAAPRQRVDVWSLRDWVPVAAQAIFALLVGVEDY